MFLIVGSILTVRYMKRLNIQSGMVGACRLDLAYEYFKVSTAVGFVVVEV
jgi:hypothetical protein